MAESSLTPSYRVLREYVGEYLIGGDAYFDQYPDSEQRTIDRVIDSGLRWFYQPPAIGNPARVHDWTFLRDEYLLTTQPPYTTGSITIALGIVTLTGGTWPSWAADARLLVNGMDYLVDTRDSNTQLTLEDLTITVSTAATFELHVDDYTLPDNFGMQVGQPVYLPYAPLCRFPLYLVSIQSIREDRSRMLSLGSQPYKCAIWPKPFDETVGNRWQITFYPKVSSTYQIQIPYRIRMERPTTEHAYPIGASDHAECVIAACMAAAERHKEQSAGVHYQRFMECLQSAVARDQQNYNGISQGRMYDLAAESPGLMARWPYWPHLVTN